MPAINLSTAWVLTILYLLPMANGARKNMEMCKLATIKGKSLKTSFRVLNYNEYMESLGSKLTNKIIEREEASNRGEEKVVKSKTLIINEINAKIKELATKAANDENFAKNFKKRVQYQNLKSEVKFSGDVIASFKSIRNPSVPIGPLHANVGDNGFQYLTVDEIKKVLYPSFLSH